MYNQLLNPLPIFAYHAEEELLEGDSKHVGYVGIIDQIMIDDSLRLKQENQILRINKDKLESRLDKLEEMYRSLI